MAESQKFTNRTALIVLAVLVVGAVTIPTFLRPRAAADSPSKPETVTSFKQAADRSGKDGRPIYLEFSAPWCHYCQEMKIKILPDPQVRTALKKVIYLPVDYDREKELAEKLGVTGIPAGFLLKVSDNEVRVINQYDGALDKWQFLEFLAEAGK